MSPRASPLLVALVLAPAAALAQPSPALPTQPWRPPPPFPGETRGLPLCTPTTPRPRPGEPYTCRDPIGPSPMGFVLGLELGTGITRARSPLQGSTVSTAVSGDVRLTRALSFGVRYQFITSGDESRDGPDQDDQDDVDTPNLSAHLLSVGPRLRLWNDETAREAWVFETDGGWVFNPNGALPDGPFVRASVGRQFGELLGEHTATQLSLHLSVLQGLGDAVDLRSVQALVRISPEWGTPEPSDIARNARPAGFHYVFGMQWFMLGGQAGGRGGFALSPGLGVFFGLPLTRWLEPRIEADFNYLNVPGGDTVIHYTALAGLRLRLNGLAPVYLQALGGWQEVTGTEPFDYQSGPVVDVGLGLNLASCGGAGLFGVHYRHGLTPENEDLHAIFLVLGGAYGSLRGSAGEEPLGSGRSARCGAPQRARVPLPPPPPRPPPSPPPSSPVTVAYTPSEVVPPRVEVTTPTVALTPIELEVTLGYVLLGGLIQVEVRPELLPLARLRAAGLVTVRVTGPAESLPGVEAQLRMVLGNEGVRVEGFTALPSSSGEVRAVFTLWPPGTRR